MTTNSDNFLNSGGIVDKSQPGQNEIPESCEDQQALINCKLVKTHNAGVHQPVSEKIFRIELNGLNFFEVITQKCLKLSKSKRIQSLQQAKEYQHWRQEIWSDESRFYLCFNDTFSKVIMKAGDDFKFECVQKSAR